MKIYTMKKIFFLLVLIIGSFSAFATHNRAGEITYKHISGFKYKITVTTYTSIAPGVSADRCDLMVYFGDGDSASASRINGSSSLCAFPVGDGEPIAGTYTKKNIYEVFHIYLGAGNYAITMEDPNRNEGICNILNSVDKSFYLITHLVINPLLPANSSPTLLRPPLDEACVNQCFEHNPGAYDLEGDSLYYTLKGSYANGAPIPIPTLWWFPPNMNANSINHQTGDILWCSPNIECEYNVAILIEEWKKYPSPSSYNRYFVGSILRDMQIEVIDNCNNTPPQINTINDTCIFAGTNLNFGVTATDAEGNLVSLSATGGPLVSPHTATFFSSPGIGLATGTFNWTPNCDDVQLLAYQVTFKATDNASPVALVNFESVGIRVIAPPLTGLTITPSGASMILNWSTPFCNALVGVNPLKGYLIYRKKACDPFIPGPCETGVPSYTGYTYIGTKLAPSTTFTDNNGGLGLTHGVDYSYIVVAYYADGSQSVASTNVCAQLVRDVPIITNVSVVSTSNSTGTIWTHWVKPIGDSTNLDTLINPPPYIYQLMKARGLNPVASSYVPISSYSYANFWQLTDTGYVNTGLNTLDSAYTYRVDFYSNGLLKGSTHTASSVFLSSTPSDNQITLTWQELVPWVNNMYFIYKDIASVYTLIDSTASQSFLDTGLVNGVTYCYKIVSRGQYSDTTLPSPLYNLSQIRCDEPIDLIPPCQPNFIVASDCGIFQNVLSWQNPNTYCSDDAVQYNVYFAPNTTDPLVLVYSTTDMSNTLYSHVYDYDGIPSVAGCYAVTAVDSFANESPIINKICVDNCPLYELPNIFTPNGDNANDFFISLPYRYVKDIEIKIYDRWGLLLFETTDPDVMWNGTNAKGSKAPCSDGTYFYVCIVNEIRLEGIVPRVLKGFVQLIKDKTGPNH